MPLAVQILRGKQRQSRAWEVRWLVRRVAGKAAREEAQPGSCNVPHSPRDLEVNFEGGQ